MLMFGRAAAQSMQVPIEIFECLLDARSGSRTRGGVPSYLRFSKALKSLVSAAAKSGFWTGVAGKVKSFSLCLMGLCRHVDRLAEVERKAN
jgi:hypothetical protein